MTDEQKALKELLIATLMESDEVIDAMESYSSILRLRADRLATIGEELRAEEFVGAYVNYVGHFIEVCRTIFTA